MKMAAFGLRNAKEILRDPLTLAFSLGFPLALLLLFSAIAANAPAAPFELSRLTPGIAVFGLSFMTLFSATLIAKDRESALLQRLYTTPLTGMDFILGYALPILPMAVGQSLVCYLAALALGLPFTAGMLWAAAFILPISLLYVALGLLCGSVLNVKQVGGVCGALFTNLSAWLSGAWFDLDLVGGAFQRAAYALPFVHAVELERALLEGRWALVPAHLAWVAGYALAAAAAAVLLFLRQMRRQ